MKVKIVPTILVSNFAEFKERLGFLSKYFNYAQIDCEDGKFVKNKTFYDKYEVGRMKAEVDYELHLMVKEPLKEIKKWAGVKKVKKVIFHYEAVRNDKKILEIIDFIHKNKFEAALAINPQTKVEKILKFLPKLDCAFIMGVNPGWGGQKISLKVVKSKARKVRKLLPKLDIEVDGGVNLKNARGIIKAGANILAVGKSLNSKENIIKFKTL